MCMLRITTYEECWAQYTHLLICSVESYNNNQNNSPGARDRVDAALGCPNLKSEHAHIKNSKCVCKIYPTEGLHPIRCERMWGGDFVGDVSCKMLPNSAVRFEFRDRQWQNCTNLEKLLKDDQRIVSDTDKSAMTTQAWHDSEWDGDSKLVDWRDTDWVNLAEKGLSMWQSQKQTKVFGGQDTVMQDRTWRVEERQTYDELQLEKSEMFSTQHNLHKPKGQVSLPLYNRSANHHVGNINDAVVKWRKLKDQREATPNDQFMPPSAPSVGQPRFQRQSSVVINNLSTTDQAQHRKHFDAFEEAKARAKLIAERRAQGNALSPSTSAAQKPSIVPTGLNMMPVWEVARLLREKENKERQSGAQSTAAVQTSPLVPTEPRMIPVWEAARRLKERQEKEGKEFGAQSGEFMQSLADPVPSINTGAKDDDRSLQYANQAANVGTRVSASWEKSSAPAYANESSQSRRQREQDERRSTFLQNTYKQRLSMREKRLNHERQGAGQPAQGDNQSINIHTFAQQGTVEHNRGSSFPVWNGVPEFVVSREYNDTLPESDDRNFNFNKYSSTRHHAEEGRTLVPHQTLDSAPKDPLKVTPQAPNSVLKDCLSTSRPILESVLEGPFLTTPLPREVEKVEARLSNLETDHIENLTQTHQIAEKKVMSMIPKVEEYPRIQPIDQETPMQDSLDVQSQPDILLKESRLLQDIFKGKAKRTPQDIEDQSKIEGNKSMREILHDQYQPENFLQNFTPSQEEIVGDMWVVENKTADEEHKEPLRITTAVVSHGNENELHANKKIDNSSGGFMQDDSGKESDEDEVHLQSGSRHSDDPNSKRHATLIRSTFSHNFSMKILLDEDKMNIFTEGYPIEHRKMARESWLAEVPVVSNHLRKSLNGMRRFGIKECEESEIMEEFNQRETENDLMRKLDNRVQDMIRGATRSMRPKQKIDYAELEKQMAISDMMNNRMFQTRVQPIEGDDLTCHNEYANITNSQQKMTGRIREDQGAIRDTQYSDIEAETVEAEIEAQKNRKRDLSYFGSLPLDMVAKKIKSGNDKPQVESEEARKKRSRDLYYSGLIPSMDVEKSGEQNLPIGSDEDQNESPSQLQHHNLLAMKHDISDDEELQPEDSSGNQPRIYSNYKANNRRVKKKRMNKGIRNTEPVEVPNSFHKSYSKNFPKRVGESKVKFRKRKTEAYLNSREYQKQQSASAGSVSNTMTDLQKKAGNGASLPESGTDLEMQMANSEGDQMQNEANSGRQRRARKQPSRKQKLAAKLQAGQIATERQPISNPGEEGVQATPAIPAAKSLGVGNQINSNMGSDGEQKIVGELVEKPHEFEYQMKSSESDDEDLPDYESDKNLSMKMDIGSQSQSTALGLVDSQRLQSVNTAVSAVAQPQEKANEASEEKTVVDLTIRNAWEEVIDLTSD